MDGKSIIQFLDDILKLKHKTKIRKKTHLRSKNIKLASRFSASVTLIRMKQKKNEREEEKFYPNINKRILYYSKTQKIYFYMTLKMSLQYVSWLLL